MIIGFIIFFLGLIFGSFLNSLEYRLEKNKPLKGRSFCPKCQKTIAWYDNIPVISWIILRGRCRHCRKKISFQYPLVEILVGLIFYFTALKTGLILSLNDYLFLGAPFPAKIFFLFLLLAVIGFVLVLIALYDAKTKYILSSLLYYLALPIILYHLFYFEGQVNAENILAFFLPFALSAIIPAIFFWAIFKFSRGKAMGAGDSELAFVIGLLLGWPNTLIAFYFAFLLGALVGVYQIVSGRGTLKTEIPFGPFLVVGSFAALFWGEQVVSLYVKMFLGG